MPKKNKFSINKKQINWQVIKTVTSVAGGITGVIFSWIAFYEKSPSAFYLSTIVIILILLIYFVYSSHKEKNLKEFFKRESNKLKNKIKILQNNICPNCKKVYSHDIDEIISFDENMRDCFSVVDELSDKEGMVYQLNWYIFIDFSLHLEDRDNESYLIDLVNGSIYLPLDDKWEKIIDGELSYRIFCSKRRISHPGRTRLI